MEKAQKLSSYRKKHSYKVSGAHKTFGRKFKKTTSYLNRGR